MFCEYGFLFTDLSLVIPDKMRYQALHTCWKNRKNFVRTKITRNRLCYLKCVIAHVPSFYSIIVPNIVFLYLYCLCQTVFNKI